MLPGRSAPGGGVWHPAQAARLSRSPDGEHGDRQALIGKQASTTIGGGPCRSRTAMSGVPRELGVERGAPAEVKRGSGRGDPDHDRRSRPEWKTGGGTL